MTMTLPMTAHTQRQHVLARLLDGPVCSTVLLNDGIPRAAARVHELRRSGFAIVTRRCSQHHHGSRQIEYVLIGGPGGGAR